MVKRFFFLLLFPLVAEGMIDIEAKRKNAILLVKKAIDFIVSHPLPQAMDAFLTDLSWRKGELAVSLIDSKGYIILDAVDSSNIWSKIDNFEKMKQKAKNGGDWILYTKNDRVFTAYVEQVRKGDEWYIVHTGFFSYRAEDKIYYFLEDIIEYYTQHGLNATVNLINESKMEVKAAFFPFICDLSGTCLAYERFPQYIGQQIFNGPAGRMLTSEEKALADSKEFKDQESTSLLEQIHTLLASPEQGGWIGYMHNGELIWAYIEKLGPDHFIGASYAPDVSQDTAVNLVQDTIRYLRSYGPEITFNELNNNYNEFGRGGLEVVVFDLEGNVYAAPFHPQWVGTNILDLTYDRNVKPVQDVLRELAVDYTSWTSFVNQQQTWTVYSERIDTTEGNFAVTCAFNVHTKEQAVKTLMLQAVDFYNKHTPVEAFAAFTGKDSVFQEGDVHLFIYDMNGNCLVKGPNYDLIWQNFLGFEDQRGNYIVDEIINQANLIDTGWLTFTIHNETYRVLIDHIYETMPTQEAEGLEYYRSYVLGAGYYL